MRKLLISWIALLTFLTAGCSSTGEKRDQDSERRRDQKVSWWTKWSIVYQPEVQQGNIINQEMVNKLRPGMDRRQVQFILGTPLLVDVFHQDRWDFFYSLDPGSGEYDEQSLSLFFEGNRLVRIQGDIRPEPTTASAASEEVVVNVPDHEAEDKGIITIILEKLRFGADW